MSAGEGDRGRLTELVRWKSVLLPPLHAEVVSVNVWFPSSSGDSGGTQLLPLEKSSGIISVNEPAVQRDFEIASSGVQVVLPAKLMPSCPSNESREPEEGGGSPVEGCSVIAG